MIKQKTNNAIEIFISINIILLIPSIIITYISKTTGVFSIKIWLIIVTVFLLGFSPLIYLRSKVERWLFINKFVIRSIRFNKNGNFIESHICVRLNDICNVYLSWNSEIIFELKSGIAISLVESKLKIRTIRKHLARNNISIEDINILPDSKIEHLRNSIS